MICYGLINKYRRDIITLITNNVYLIIWDYSMNLISGLFIASKIIIFDTIKCSIELAHPKNYLIQMLGDKL